MLLVTPHYHGPLMDFCCLWGRSLSLHFLCWKREFVSTHCTGSETDRVHHIQKIRGTIKPKCCRRDKCYQMVFGGRGREEVRQKEWRKWRRLWAIRSMKNRSDSLESKVSAQHDMRMWGLSAAYRPTEALTHTHTPAHTSSLKLICYRCLSRVTARVWLAATP